MHESEVFSKLKMMFILFISLNFHEIGGKEKSPPLYNLPEFRYTWYKEKVLSWNFFQIFDKQFDNQNIAVFFRQIFSVLVYE